jgi:hypothetical protein
MTRARVVAWAWSFVAACSPLVDADRFEFGRDAASGQDPRDGGGGRSDASADGKDSADAAIPTDGERDAATSDGGADADSVLDPLACSDGDVDAASDRSFSTMSGGDLSASACGGQGAPEQHFVFRPETSGWYTIETVGASYDVVLSTSDACGAAASACRRDATRADAFLAAKLEAGVPTLISVDGFSPGEGGSGTLRVRPVTCPDQALALPSQRLSTASGRDDFGSPCGGAGFKERALVWTAPEDGLYRFRVLADDFSPVLSLLDGPLCSDERLTCARGKGVAEVTRFVAREQSRTLIVDGLDGEGDVTLEVSRVDTDEAPGCPQRTITEGIAQADYQRNYGSALDAKLEAWWRNDLGAGEIGDTRTVGASCADATFADGRAFGDVSFAFTLPPLLDETLAGSCQVGVSSYFPVALAVHEGATCSGAELGCAVSAYAEDVQHQWAGISMKMRKGPRPLILSVARAAAYPKGPFRVELEIACTHGNAAVFTPGPVLEVER